MKLTILIADDEQPARFGLRKALDKLDYKILEASNGREALESIRNEAPDLVFLDLNMPELDGQAVLSGLEGATHRPEIIVVTADDTVESAISCMRLGATDYLTKPYEVERLRAIARKSANRVALEMKVSELQDRIDGKTAQGALLGISRPMRELFTRMERASRAPLDILLRGETGSGKELIARQIHDLSSRATGPFIAVNAAAISESLAESELFGHKKGAFTGATTDRDGVFVQANGGTLFLDEIGDMPAVLQTKVLRALQEREVTPVGGSRTEKVDVRVISATHQDLTQSIEEGHFRQDLYYRVRGIHLQVPPLRTRGEDILLLANHFLDGMKTRDEGPFPRLSSATQKALFEHSWPGNVRELKQVITAAAAMTVGDVIEPVDLGLCPSSQGETDLDISSLEGLPLTEAKNQLLQWFERRAIHAALDRNQGNVSAAARTLGIHRQSLQQKMTQLDIKKT